MVLSLADKLPKDEAIPFEWIYEYAVEPFVDEDGKRCIVYEKNHIDTMLEEWAKINEWK